MNNYSRLILSAAFASALVCGCQKGTSTPPEAIAPVPTQEQVEWQKMEMNMFTHFGPNTFTGREWGLGTEAEDIFNPTDLDCRQWASIAKAAGFKGMIITAKHHDGFCLWPNPVSTHTVAQSPWRDGKGDVLKDLSEACAAEGVKFGVYVSPWDRNDPHYGSPEYNEVFIKTLQNVLGSYGEVFEQWFDGANGEGPNGKKQVYDWPRFNGQVYELQPHAVIFSDIGPGCRWVGNENGVLGRTNWSLLTTEGFAPGREAPSTDVLNQGQIDGAAWVPAEADVSIRPGWFWRESENDKVKTVRQLLDLYYTSVGRNAVLLLNVPPDTTGRFNAVDSLRLMEFAAAKEGIFSNNLAAGAKVSADVTRGSAFKAAKALDGDYDSYWAAPDDVLTASITVDFKGEKTFNLVQLQEYIPLGQRVKTFTVEALVDGSWKEIASETTIGFKRIVPVETTSATGIRINITDSRACPTINGIGVFLDTVE